MPLVKQVSYATYKTQYYCRQNETIADPTVLC
jgi:hypothetical protein